MASDNDSAKRHLSSQPLEKVLAMSSGGGEDSYSQNSEYQAFLVNKFCLPYLDQALELVDLPAGRTMVVADLGCSSGPNTIRNLSYIVEKLRARYTEVGSPPPDFQAFCNDLPSNDFNHLFQLLTSDPRTSSLFVGGVPGSFYGRLFPFSSIDVFFSSNCLHWLSKIPDAVLDKASAAYNGDSIWINGSNLAAAVAYKEQALSDLRAFLQARADEMASGGLLFLVFNGRPDSEPNKQLRNPEYPYARGLNAMEDVWSQLISEGLFTEEQHATFNIPHYYCNLEELQEALGTYSSDFHIQTAKCHVESIVINKFFHHKNIAKKMVGVYKSIFNPLLEGHVGNLVRK